MTDAAPGWIARLLRNRGWIERWLLWAGVVLAAAAVVAGVASRTDPCYPTTVMGPTSPLREGRRPRSRRAKSSSVQGRSEPCCIRRQ